MLQFFLKNFFCWGRWGDLAGFPPSVCYRIIFFPKGFLIDSLWFGNLVIQKALKSWDGLQDKQSKIYGFNCRLCFPACKGMKSVARVRFYCKPFRSKWETLLPPSAERLLFLGGRPMISYSGFAGEMEWIPRSHSLVEIFASEIFPHCFHLFSHERAKGAGVPVILQTVHCRSKVGRHFHDLWMAVIPFFFLPSHKARNDSDEFISGHIIS